MFSDARQFHCDRLTDSVWLNNTLDVPLNVCVKGGGGTQRTLVAVAVQHSHTYIVRLVGVVFLEIHR